MGTGEYRKCGLETADRASITFALSCSLYSLNRPPNKGTSSQPSTLTRVTRVLKFHSLGTDRGLPTRRTSSTPCSSNAAEIAPSWSSLLCPSAWGTCTVFSPAASARAITPASALFETTTSIEAGSSPLAIASITPWRDVPRVEARTPRRMGAAAPLDNARAAMSWRYCMPPNEICFTPA